MTRFVPIRNLNKLVASLMVAALFAAAFFSTGLSAKAADNLPVTGTATLTGSQAVNSVTNLTFTGNLTGKTQPDLTSSFTADVSDTTNSNGWKLTAAMPHMMNSTVDLGTMPKITDSTPANVIGAVSNSITYATPITLDGSDTTPVIIFATSKATDQGQSALITFNSSLGILPTTADGTYTSNLTLTIAVGV